MRNRPGAPAGGTALWADATDHRRHYNVSEAAALLGVSRVSVWRWIRAGRLRAVRLGHRTVRIAREDLQRIAARGAPGRPRLWGGQDPVALQQQARSLEAALASERAARRAAEAALRLRDEFLSIAAHELKTPLAALVGTAQLVLRRLTHEGHPEPERVAQALQALTSQGDKLSRLIDQLVDDPRLEAGKLAPERGPTDPAALGEVEARG